MLQRVRAAECVQGFHADGSQASALHGNYFRCEDIRALVPMQKYRSEKTDYHEGSMDVYLTLLSPALWICVYFFIGLLSGNLQGWGNER